MLTNQNSHAANIRQQRKPRGGKYLLPPRMASEGAKKSQML